MSAAAFGTDIWFFGGVGAKTGTESILDVSNDLWSFDTNRLAWHEISVIDNWPSPRRCPGWRSSPKGIYLWGGSGLKKDVAGGTTYNFLNDLWLLDPVRQVWQEIETSEDCLACPHENALQPPPRYTPVLHEHNGSLILFGGYTEDLLGKRKMNDLWIRDREAKWKEISSDCFHHGYIGNAKWPGVRYGSMSASIGDNLLICGGFSDGGDHIDVWQLNCQDFLWHNLSPDQEGDDFPPKRYCAAMVCFGNALYLFGGRSRRYPKLDFNDLWRFNLSTCRWEMVHGNRIPHCYDANAEFPAYHAKSAVALIGHHMYLCCGEGLHGHVSDFWQLDLKSLNWELIQAARPDDPMFW